MEILAKGNVKKIYETLIQSWCTASFTMKIILPLRKAIETGKDYYK